MSARGGSRPPPRGRPNKVTKAAAVAGIKRDPQALARATAAASRHPPSAVDHQLEQLAHDAEAEAEHEDDDEITAPPPPTTSQQHHQHQQQHHQQHHPNAFDLAAAGILANGPPPPDSDIHPDLHGLPAQFAMEAHMGSQGGHGGPGDIPLTAEDLAKQSGYHQLVIDSALAKRLANNEGHRLAVQRRGDQNLNLKRRSNVEALLAHVSENNLPQHMPAVQMPPQVSANTSFAGAAPMAPGMVPAGPSGFGQPGGNHTVAQFTRDALNRAMAEVRSDDPNIRFQFRIETAARELALASAEYADFLAQQAGHDPSQHPQDGEGSVPEAAMGDGNDGP
ncbi:hypothetical protein K4K54_004700 [Colletotrichum sp. SAR 10_86]|nr:hypothetical protein K4K51_002208 [Colletotrichum sp. SAR 10_75]KAI8209889.1 hypothetical protein K4K52_013065 [Colletotrichum sp. SAR 10_76]KAI8225220.1 hypothetical protein K4K54_004700 [Colletotrichum sp. SAR 10_86]KAI8314960.1 hypothetical protein K4K59_001947 [Colletotrichum sp. SAR11_240]